MFGGIYLAAADNVDDLILVHAAKRTGLAGPFHLPAAVRHAVFPQFGKTVIPPALCQQEHPGRCCRRPRPLKPMKGFMGRCQYGAKIIAVIEMNMKIKNNHDQRRGPTTSSRSVFRPAYQLIQSLFVIAASWKIRLSL